MADEAQLKAFFADLEQSLGAEAINLSQETVARYGENTMPGGDQRPGGVVFPGSTTDVQAVVRAANRHGVPLWPVSTGNNQGLGMKSPVRPGQVVVDLGRRMNRIVEIDESLCFAEIEPGVSYQQMYDELVRRGDKMMMDSTSGPPEGGILGNTLDKGAGYTPYFDHFYMCCGIEVVLGNGEVLRTGDGGLANSKAWHISKYSFGPELAGLFAQSNFGIVTRIGVWLMPRPPAIRSFHFSFPDDDDLGDIIDLIRPLKLSNFVPTLFRLSNDIYLFGTEASNPEYAASGGKAAISDGARKALQQEHGVGAWIASGAFYGPSDEALEPMIERVRAHFAQSNKAGYIAHEEAEDIPALDTAIKAFSGIPTPQELGLLKWRPGGGNAWLLPGMPMIGDVANRHQTLARGILEQHGLDYCIMNVCGARFARELINIGFNREDDDERQRADDAYKALARAFAEDGYSVGRSPTTYQGFHMGLLEPVVRDTCGAIKHALDPTASSLRANTASNSPSRRRLRRLLRMRYVPNQPTPHPEEARRAVSKGVPCKPRVFDAPLTRHKGGTHGDRHRDRTRRLPVVGLSRAGQLSVQQLPGERCRTSAVPYQSLRFLYRHPGRGRAGPRSGDHPLGRFQPFRIGRVRLAQRLARARAAGRTRVQLRCGAHQRR